MGLIYSDALGSERHHRLNMRASKQNMLGFPDIGDYDTWLVDILQKMVQDNHDVQAFPGWVNSSDFAPTNEVFGFVDLAPDWLRDKIDKLEVTPKLSKDLTFLAKATGLKTLPLPWHTVQERKLFPRLLNRILEEFGGIGDTVIASKLTIKVLEHMGEHIFPKLDVHS